MYKSRGKKGLFDKEFTDDKLVAIGNPLDALSKVIDFEMFRSTLEKNLLNTNKKNNAKAKPYDVVLLFKIIIYKVLKTFSILSNLICLKLKSIIFCWIEGKCFLSSNSLLRSKKISLTFVIFSFL